MMNLYHFESGDQKSLSTVLESAWVCLIGSTLEQRTGIKELAVVLVVDR